jgi:hypothetical protein
MIQLDNISEFENLENSLKKINIQKKSNSILENSFQKQNIIKTKINLNNIENKINSILDKFDEFSKYYIHITENSWVVSFRVDINQLDALMKTSFEINIYKDINNNAILAISNEILEHPQWKTVYEALLRELK